MVNAIISSKELLHNFKKFMLQLGEGMPVLFTYKGSAYKIIKVEEKTQTQRIIDLIDKEESEGVWEPEAISWEKDKKGLNSMFSSKEWNA